MDRRQFLKSAVAGTLAAGFATTASAERFFPTPVDQSLFQNINRAKDPAKKTPLERSHAPVIKAPATVKAGEIFTVEVSVGEKLHDMSPVHWIETVALYIGNEPAGRAEFQPKGYLKPRVTFNVVVPKEAAPNGMLTLVANQRCNLHGYWESTLDIKVV
ncbi:MAG TPA: desulfoferrodoxin family protein [Geomonas sp.]|nr:desulfoferrodoxin family protein [Geomonas sp.]